MAHKQPEGTNGMTAVETKPQSVRLEIPPEVHRQFRIESAKEGLSMAAVARQLVEDWLKHGRQEGGNHADCYR